MWKEGGAVKACKVCGVVPRAFWLFGRVKFWERLFGEDLCPGCAMWAVRMGVRFGQRWIPE